MKNLLSAAGRAFLRAGLAALVVYAYGLSHATTLSGLKVLGVAALLGSLAAGLRGIQAYIPNLTFSKWLPMPWGALVDSFVHGFLAAFVASLIGILSLPSLSAWHSAIVGAIVGAITAGFRAVQALATVDEPPARGKGIPNPKNA